MNITLFVTAGTLLILTKESRFKTLRDHDRNSKWRCSCADETEPQPCLTNISQLNGVEIQHWLRRTNRHHLLTASISISESHTSLYLALCLAVSFTDDILMITDVHQLHCYCHCVIECRSPLFRQCSEPNAQLLLVRRVKTEENRLET